jgi:hypothetical protein
MSDGTALILLRAALIRLRNLKTEAKMSRKRAGGNDEFTLPTTAESGPSGDRNERIIIRHNT